MGYAITQIKDANGNYIDWDGRLVPQTDGTLGSVVIKKVLEEKVIRAHGEDVTLAVNADTIVATHSVPVGKVHKVFGYALSHDNSNVDKFSVKVDAVVQAVVYTNTYQGGDVDDYILIDNSAGSAPVVVTLTAHNAALATARKGSGHILVEDVTDSQAP